MDDRGKGLRMVGALKARDGFAHQLWGRMDALRRESGERRALMESLRGTSAQVERLCFEHRATLEALETPTRQVYCWMRYLSAEPNLERHLDALYRVRSLIRELGLMGSGADEVHLINMGSLWRHKPKLGVLRVHEGMVLAGRPVWSAVLGSALRRHTAAQRQTVRAYTATEPFRGVIAALERYAEAPEHTLGQVHDLARSFARVNRQYFGGRMDRPRLAWTQRATSRCFGRYDDARDVVTLSLTLDDTRVPRFVVDFVMYHELLHKKHGAVLIGTRRMCHTRAFRQDERLFLRFEQAEAHLQTLAMRARR